MGYKGVAGTLACQFEHDGRRYSAQVDKIPLGGGHELWQVQRADARPAASVRGCKVAVEFCEVR